MAAAAESAVATAEEAPAHEFLRLVREQRPNPSKGTFLGLGRKVGLVANNTLSERNLLKSIGISGILGRYYRIRDKHRSNFELAFYSVDRFIQAIEVGFRELLSRRIPLPSNLVREPLGEAVDNLRIRMPRENPKLHDELTRLLGALLMFYETNVDSIRRSYAAAEAAPALATAPAPTAAAAPAAAAAASSPVISAGTHSLLGAGTYGAVFKPAFPNVNETGRVQSFPTNTVKVFYTPAAHERVVRMYGLLDTLMGPDEGHRYNTYRHPYTPTNLPENIRTHLPPETRALPRLHLLRMPNLGVSLKTVQNSAATYEPQIQQIPLPTLLEQIYKLLSQVDRLTRNGYIHGDIRPDNIMINAQTGNMTLIDFDLLRPFPDFQRDYPAAFGHYHSPPEAIGFRRFKILEAGTPEIAVDEYLNQVLSDYSYFTLSDYPRVWNDMYDKFMTVQILIHFNTLNLSTWTPDMEVPLMRTFDSYGISMALLNFLGQLIPHLLTFYVDVSPSVPGSVEFLAHNLRNFTNRGTAYSADQANTYTICLVALVRDVLVPLAKLRHGERRTISDVLPAAAAALTAAGIPVPPPAAMPIGGGGGGAGVGSIVASAPPASPPAVTRTAPIPIPGRAAAAAAPTAALAPSGFVNVSLSSTRRRRAKRRGTRSRK
jgi:serine/threonine protein kinase